MTFIFLFDALRYDTFSHIFRNKKIRQYFSDLTKFENCYTHCGWTPLAIAHMFNGMWPSSSGLLPLSTKKKKYSIIWEKERQIDRESINYNILNCFENVLAILFEWRSIETFYNFYQADKQKTTILTYNRIIDNNFWINFDYKKAVADTVKFIKKNKNNDRSCVFVRLMGTHVPFLSFKETHQICKEFNQIIKKENIKYLDDHDDILHGLYKFAFYKFIKRKGIKSATLDQAKGFLFDWNNYCAPVINYLKKIKKYNNSQLIFCSDHGETIQPFAHLIGHARFCNQQVAHTPLFYKFKKARYSRKKINHIVHNLDIVYTAVKEIGIESRKYNNYIEARHLINDKEIKKNEFHCKEDFFFFFPESSKSNAILLSNKKKILAKISWDDRLFYKTEPIPRTTTFANEFRNLIDYPLSNYSVDSIELGHLFIKDLKSAKKLNNNALRELTNKFMITNKKEKITILDLPLTI